MKITVLFVVLFSTLAAVGQQIGGGLSSNFYPGALMDAPNRQLSIASGRWISTDPYRMGWNQYVYTTNPLSYTDTEGLATCIDGAGGDENCDYSSIFGGGGVLDNYNVWGDTFFFDPGFSPTFLDSDALSLATLAMYPSDPGASAAKDCSSTGADPNNCYSVSVSAGPDATVKASVPQQPITPFSPADGYPWFMANPFGDHADPTLQKPQGTIPIEDATVKQTTASNKQRNSPPPSVDQQPITPVSPAENIWEMANPFSDGREHLNTLTPPPLPAPAPPVKP